MLVSIQSHLRRNDPPRHLQHLINVEICHSCPLVAQFGFIKTTYDVTEGLNSTISLCTALKVGSLGKSVTLKLESKGKKIRNFNSSI